MKSSIYPNGTEVGRKDFWEQASEVFSALVVLTVLLMTLTVFASVFQVLQGYIIVDNPDNISLLLIPIIGFYAMGYGCCKKSETYGQQVIRNS